MRSFWRGALLTGGVVLTIVGCSDEVALRVGEVSYNSTHLLGRSDRQVEELTLLTAVGIAVARGEVESLGERIVQDEVEDRILRRLEEEEALARAGIDEQALERWYFDHPDPELLVRHLVVLSDRWDSPEDRAEAADRAREALDRIRQGDPFPEVAGEVSEEPGARERGGLLEPGREGSWVREFWTAAHALEPGQVSEVIETQFGFHVLKLDERRAVAFSEARQGAVSRLVAEMSLLPLPDRVGAPDQAATSDREMRLAEAHRRGVDLTSQERSEIVGRGASLVGRWGETFGFQLGMTPDELSEQAMVALGLSGQEAILARMELMEWSEPIRSAYRIEENSP